MINIAWSQVEPLSLDPLFLSLLLSSWECEDRWCEDRASMDVRTYLQDVCCVVWCGENTARLDTCAAAAVRLHLILIALQTETL